MTNPTLHMNSGENGGLRPGLNEDPTRVVPVRPGIHNDPTLMAAAARPAAAGAAASTQAAQTVPTPPVTELLKKTRTLGPYTLLRLLGRGGMGAVWEAVDQRLDRHVALKVMIGNASPDAIERFRREGQHSARLRHANIVPVYDVGYASGRQYLVMDLVQGSTLTEALRAGALTYRDKATVLEKICRAVHYAHEQGVVHRDLKPSNIMLDSTRGGSSSGPGAEVRNEQGEDPTESSALSGPWKGLGEPLVMDFGLAKDTTSDSSLSQTGQAMGTPSYMPPEQAEGRLDMIGPCSDIYSLGAMLYEMLTGRPPFTGENVMQVLKAVINDEPIAPRRISPDVSRDLETICLTCLAKQPERRYVSAAALADDLRAWLAGDNIRARPATWLQRCVRRVRRHRAAYATACLSVITLVGSTVGFMWSLQTQRDAALQSEAHATKALAESAISRQAEAAAEQTRKTEESRRKSLESKAEAERAREWRLVVSDDFSDPEATSHKWDIDGASSKVVDGEFHILKSSPCVLILKQSLAGDVRIDWECRFADCDIDDLSCFICAESWLPGRQVVQTGYEFKSGAYRNSKNMLKRHGKTLFTESFAGLVPDHVYHARAEKIGTRLRYLVDDRVVFDVVDPEPLAASGGQASIGLTCWGADARWDNVRVYTLGAPLRADVLEIAEQQLAVGRITTASDLLRDVLETASDETRRAAARAGLTRAAQQQALVSCRRTLAESWPSARVAVDAAENGTIRVSATGLGLADLAPLRGMPISDLDLDGNHVSDLAPLAGMPLRKLNLSNNGPIDLGQLAILPLISLNLAGTGITDLGLLRGMKLESLICEHTTISSLEPLRGMPLTILSCSETLVTSLKPVYSSPLQQLYCAHTPITSFAGIGHALATTLKTLNIGQNTIDSLSDFSELRLEFLNCSDNRISDLSPLRGMTTLNGLECDRNRIASLRPLSGIALNYLNLRGNPIDDLAPLHGMPLLSLDCSGGRLASLEPLRGMLLTTLICSNNRITSVEPLRGMKSLAHFVADSNKLTDIEPLRGLALQTAGFTANRLASLDVLRGMPLMSVGCASNALTSLEPLRGGPLRWLNCGNNALADLPSVIASLRSLESLDCWKTGLTDLASVAGLKLTKLRCSWNAITSLEPLRGMPMISLDCNGNPIRSLDALPRTSLDWLQCAACPLDSLAPLMDCPPKQGTFALDRIPEDQVRQIIAWDKASPRFALAASVQLAIRHHDAGALAALTVHCAGHRFLAVPDLRSSQDAAAIAQQLGGHLAVLSTQAEWDAVRPLLFAGENWLWLGGKRTATGITWSDGSPAAVDGTIAGDRELEGQVLLARDGWHVYGVDDGGLLQYLIEWDH
ncbi:MAG: leucine-rich repeat domain-containing protein [Planctomycetes bacterium]|nr:leucine-rich repeat domain-containing protein [Planctomycetota bacterium]